MKGRGEFVGNCAVALLLGAGLLVMGAHPASAYPDGVSGAAITGCTCHGATSNSGVGVTVTGLPEERGYVAGAVYPLTVTVNGGPSANSGDSQAGFDLEVTAGSLAPTGDGSTQACSDPFPQGATKGFTCVSPNSGNGGTAITHTEDGNKKTSWTVNWTAPTLPLPVALFVAGNKVNGDGGTSGDAWNTSSYTVVPAH